eukprot:354124-Prymnesium_polylepis.1
MSRHVHVALLGVRGGAWRGGAAHASEQRSLPLWSSVAFFSSAERALRRTMRARGVSMRTHGPPSARCGHQSKQREQPHTPTRRGAARVARGAVAFGRV